MLPIPALPPSLPKYKVFGEGVPKGWVKLGIIFTDWTINLPFLPFSASAFRYGGPTQPAQDDRDLEEYPRDDHHRTPVQGFQGDRGHPAGVRPQDRREALDIHIHVRARFMELRVGEPRAEGLDLHPGAFQAPVHRGAEHDQE